jgi:hypothetical protein
MMSIYFCAVSVLVPVDSARQNKRIHYRKTYGIGLTSYKIFPIVLYKKNRIGVKLKEGKEVQTFGETNQKAFDPKNERT